MQKPYQDFGQVDEKDYELEQKEEREEELNKILNPNEEW